MFDICKSFILYSLYPHYDCIVLLILKARLRNIRCCYDHAFCLECLSVVIPSYNDQNASCQTEAMDEKWICPVKKCKIKTPFRCVVQMRNAVTNSNGLVFGLFLPSKNCDMKLLVIMIQFSILLYITVLVN